MSKLHANLGLGLGLASLFLFALWLRFWGLGWFNSLVFDEIHYVPFALDYLQRQPLFDAHPPLGKYLIALGLALGQPLADGLDWPTFDFNDLKLSPIAFRWLNAGFGALVPVLVALLAFQISAAYTRQRRGLFALLAGGLMALEGLSLVESRLALINIYWLGFGLLGQWLWFVANPLIDPLTTDSSPRVGGNLLLWQIAAGLALGSAIAVKWNGASFWLALVLLELAKPLLTPWKDPGMRRSRFPLDWKKLALYLGLIPLTTYGLVWVPHLWLNDVSLVDVQGQLWAFHQSLESGPDVHPYCSAWYTWPLMLRPTAYLYETVNGSLPQSILAPVRASGTTVYTVQGMGNPILWWLATAAIIALTVGQLPRWLTAIQQKTTGLTAGHSPVTSFILINYLVNWLPWALIHRCTFLYHALGIVTFSALALAWLLSRWLLQMGTDRLLALVMLAAIGLGFWFWLPLFIGFPLSPEALQQRWWLQSWI